MPAFASLEYACQQGGGAVEGEGGRGERDILHSSQALCFTTAASGLDFAVDDVVWGMVGQRRGYRGGRVANEGVADVPDDVGTKDVEGWSWCRE